MAWYELFTKNYLLFHTTVEGFAIVIAASIFIIATRTYKFSGNMHLYVLGTAYLFVAITDYLHLLTYKGMQIFQGLTANTPTQLWIAGRYLETLSLLVFVLLAPRRMTSQNGGKPSDSTGSSCLKQIL